MTHRATTMSRAEIRGLCRARHNWPFDSVLDYRDLKPSKAVGEAGSARLPRDVEKVLRRCLRKDPERRFKRPRISGWLSTNAGGASQRPVGGRTRELEPPAVSLGFMGRSGGGPDVHATSCCAVLART